MAKLWIQEAIRKPGALRKALGAKKGKTIPVSKLKKAAKAKGKMGKRARLAMTLRKLGGSKKGESHHSPTGDWRTYFTD